MPRLLFKIYFFRFAKPMPKFKYSNVLITSLVLSLLVGHDALAFFDNPTPYDPVDPAEQVDALRSSNKYFVMDATLPVEYQRAMDDRKFFGITNIAFGGSTTLPMSDGITVYQNDRTLMSQPKQVCSTYSSDICFDVTDFYASPMPQLQAVGLFAIDGSTILQWGVNTGFQSSKLSVSPALMLGLAKRFYLSEARDAHVIFEASAWLGETIKHRPCLDSFDRQYYCGSLSSWSDFSYAHHPVSNFFKMTFEKAF